MKKFDVEITETLQRKVSVEAASQEDAERMVTQAWNNQDYVLDSGDFTGVDFKTVGEHELAETRTMNVLLVQPIVIGNVLGKYQLGISDVWISNRIDKMLEDGVLEIIQDAPKGETNYRRILRKRMK